MVLSQTDVAQWLTKAVLAQSVKKGGGVLRAGGVDRCDGISVMRSGA
jgi:hypothetical protein